MKHKCPLCTKKYQSKKDLLKHALRIHRVQLCENCLHPVGSHAYKDEGHGCTECDCDWVWDEYRGTVKL